MNTRSKNLSAVLLVGAVGIGTGITSFGTPVTAATSHSCTSSAKTGTCYFPKDTTDFPGVIPDSRRPAADAIEVDQNVWNAGSSDCAGWHQALSANSPEDFTVTANYPAGNTAVCTFTNVWPHDETGAVDSYSQTTSSFSESLPHNAQTTGWGMYDLWFNNWKNEVMIQYDFSNNAPCGTVPVTDQSFGGSDGVPVQPWHLCTFGSPMANGSYPTTAWKLGLNEARKQSESSGSIDILHMTKYLERKGYLPAGSTWTAISMGWEICSTGGKNETFTGSGFGVDMEPGATTS
jgi:hypothetical protein